MLSITLFSCGVRSSAGFARANYAVSASNKDAMDKFLVALARGVHVRRHQSGCVAELVRLYSDDGCQTISWQKPDPKALLRERQIAGAAVGRSGVCSDSSSAGAGAGDVRLSGGSDSSRGGGGGGGPQTDAIYTSAYDRSMVDCCIAGKRHIIS